ncbi:hypothetical protein HDU67_001789, partial [Dinochytrium kinnereticum]
MTPHLLHPRQDQPSPTGSVTDTRSQLPPAVLGGLIGGGVFIIVLFVLGWYFCIRPLSAGGRKARNGEKAAAANAREAVEVVVADGKG